MNEDYLYEYLRSTSDEDAEQTLDHLVLDCGYSLEEVFNAAMQVGDE